MSERSVLQRFNRRFPYPVRLLMVGAVGLGLLPVVHAAQYYGVMLYEALSSPKGHCGTVDIVRGPKRMEAFLDVRKKRVAEARVVERDEALGIVRVEVAGQSYWVKEAGGEMEGRVLVGHLVAEHEWMGESNRDEAVKAGEMVIDCGAHVGTFTRDALARGARRVVAVEPDETNLECLRRNFAAELKSGRVVLAPKAVWREETTLRFAVSDANSGMGSAVVSTGKREVEVPATTLDAIVRDYGLERVDYLKMDIEGAERQALAGGMGLLKRFRPRVMLEAYHLADDHVVLPRMLRQAHGDYREVCGPCERDGRIGEWRPYVLYYR